MEKQHQTYRQAQKDLKSAHDDILNTCGAILNRISDLESRNKNALHAKILEEYRLFTDAKKNPRKEWSEMEHHSFFQLVRDYESLGGNNFIHSVVVPEMNQLGVVPMADLEGLKVLYASRQIE